MEYSVDHIRQLARRYFDGGTTLAEEASLRDWFAGCSDIPADLRPCGLMLGHCAEIATERSRREIALRTLPRRRPLRIAIVSTAAAAAIVASVFFTVRDTVHATGDIIVCYVNGRAVTDREQKMEYVREAFEVINGNLRKPAEIISAKTGNSNAAERMGEMLNSLVNRE